MESLHKNMINNFVPPMKAMEENRNNHAIMVVVAWGVLGLFVASMISTLIVNHHTIKELKEQLSKTETKTN